MEEKCRVARRPLETGVTMPLMSVSGQADSLCERCGWVREVVTPRGSRFLLCGLSRDDPRYPKYPPQPVWRCDGFREESPGRDSR